MSATTTIEWTDATWNPVSGCTKVSPGCDRCYAQTFAERFRGTPGHYFEQGFDVTLRPAKLTDPLRWRKPRRVFVNSMSDLFHQDVPDEYVARVWAVMALAQRHTFQVLTKRHGRMRSLLSNPDFADLVFKEMCATDGALAALGWAHWPLRNVWLGVSVEDQKRADQRVPALLETPAVVRFMSGEPLLGPVDLKRAVRVMGSERGHGLTASYVHAGGCCERRFHGIDWVIVGGESGRGARPMRLDWARGLRDQCQQAGIPYFFKQTGTVAARELGLPGKGTDLDRLPADLRIRQAPQVLSSEGGVPAVLDLDRWEAARLRAAIPSTWSTDPGQYPLDLGEET